MFTVQTDTRSHAAAPCIDPSCTPGRRPRMLLLDGNARSLASLATALEDRRVAALTASDGASGVERLLEDLFSIDALVMDLDLPQRDARSIARLIRGAGNEQDLAIVVLASAPSPELRAELRALGVDAVVDRRDGPAVAVAAALEAVAARGAAEEIALESWRYAPPTPPLGEVSLWSLGGGELAGA